MEQQCPAQAAALVHALSTQAFSGLSWSLPEQAWGQGARLTACMRCTQVLQWIFAGAPGHPALRDICEHIVRSAGFRFSGNTNVDTLERTGPGAWTDAVLRQARLHPPAKVGLAGQKITRG